MTRSGPAVLPLVADAYDALGHEKKLARLRYLRDRWVRPLSAFERVHFQTPFDSDRSSALVGFSIDGIDRKELCARLRGRGFNIGTYHEPEVPTQTGLIVGANITNSLDEIDRFTQAVINLAGLS